MQVLLIAHIPPGDTTNHAEYGEFYLSITRQFSDTVVGHLFGHTHTDQFELVRKGVKLNQRKLLLCTPLI